MNNNQADQPLAQHHWTARLAVYGLSFLLASQPLMVSAQTIVSGTTATTQTTAGNGVPVINIATPSAKGVSHNQFQQYNIDAQGLVLNNAKAGVVSQLGGFVDANPHLQNSNTATLIINEVVAPNPSQLNGYSEVAGQAANVVIANPYGISCNGCGFINTPRATITTGTPNLHNGELTGFTVNGGEIAIEGQGLNASNISQFDIISRAVTVNADLHAQNLNIVAGRNQVDYATLNATKLNTTPSTTADFALDSSVLGGMYANSIRLIGTEAGVGVRTLGNVATDSGDLTLSADGKISVNKLQSAHNLTLISANNEIELNDRVHSNNTIDLQSKTTVINTAAVTAGQNINVTAANLNQQGTLATGVTVQGQNYQITQAGNLTLNISNTTTNTGKLLSGGDTSITTNTLNNQNAALIHSGQTLNIVADQLNNQKDISSSEKLTIQLSDTLTNSGSIETSANIAVDVATLTNNQGTISAAGTADSHITTTAVLNNNQGVIAANAGTLNLNGQTINNDNGQIVHSGSGELRLNSDNAISNRNGRLASNSTLTIISGSNKDQAFDNTSGTVAANDIKIESGDISNQGGTIEGNTLQITTKGDLNNGSDAQLNTGFISALSTSDDSLKLNVQGQFNNSTGTTQTNAQSATITANSIGNNGNLIHAGSGTFSINSTQAIDNSNGTILSNGTLDVAASDLNNTAGEVRTDGGDLNLVLTGDLNNTSGLIEAGEALTVSADNLNNVNGHIKSIGNQDVTITTTGELNNDAGFIEANADNLTLSGDSFSNSAGHIVHSGTGELTFNTGHDLVNHNGSIISSGRFTANAAGRLFNTNGSLLKASSIEFGGMMSVDNINSEIIADYIDIYGGSLNNTNGIISAQQYLTLQINELINLDGWLQASDTVDLSLSSDFIHDGHINALNHVSIFADNVMIDTNSLDTDGSLSISANTITNFSTISSSLSVSLDGSNLDNNGNISAENFVDINVSSIVNSFDIGAAQNITIFGDLKNWGSIAAGNDLETLGGDINNYGALFAGNDARLYAYDLYNHNGANIFSLNNLTIADFDLYRSNQIIKSNSLINHSGTIEAFNGDIVIKTKTLINKTDLPTITSTHQTTNSNLIYRPQLGGAIHTGTVALPKAQGYLVLQASQPAALAIFEDYGSNAAWNAYWTRDSRKRVMWFDVNVTRTIQSADLASISPAKLVAGNNLTIEADDITNQLSLIGAEADIQMTGNNLTNVAFSLTDTVTGNWRVGREKKRRAVPRSEPSQNNYYEQAGGINSSTVIGSLNSTIQAGGSLTGDFTHRIDNQNIKQNTAGLTHTEQGGMLGYGYGTGLIAVTPQGVATITGSTTPAALNGNLTAITPVSLQTPTFTLPTTGLFVVNTNPSHPYLVETNPTFLSNSNFTNNLTSTNRLFSGLGLNPDQFSQRLGDGFYESRLLRDAIFAQTGRRYLQGQSNDQAQFK